MATVWQPHLSWTQKIVGFKESPRPVPAHLTLGSQPLVYNQAFRRLALPEGCVAAEEFSSDARSHEQELLWRQLFLDPDMWWDNRRDKKSSRSPDFRRKGSGEVLWLNSMFKPAWVDEQLASYGDSSAKWNLGGRDKPEPGTHAEWETSFLTPATVSAFCQQGNLTEALGALESLVQTKCPISQSLLSNVLKVCAAKKDLRVGRRVHDLSVELGYESSTYLGNHILRMYACGGRLREAMDVFTRVGKPDAFMWGSIISAYAKHGKPNEAIQLYHEMQRSGVKADSHVFVAALQACGLAADLESGRTVHCDVLHSGIPPDLFVGNCLVDMYAKCGELSDARRVFDSLTSKDVVTWNALIGGYGQQGLGQDAIALYGQMKREGLIVADHVTFACLLKACASTGSLQKGRQLHAQIVERGLLDNLLVGNCLVDMYAKCGDLEAAQEVFDGLSSKDVITWNSLMVGYAKCGELERARQIFDSLSTKNVVTWNALIAGYSQQGLVQDALFLYGQMEQDARIVADHVTFACLLKACASTGALQKGRQLHSKIVERGLLSNIVVGTSLVDMYAKCGELTDAREVFDSLTRKNVVTWTALIAAYAQQGFGQDALVLHAQMEQEGLIVADHVTFACLLKACASTGSLKKGRRLQSQIEDRGLLEDTLTSTGLVDMYAKCGELEEARRVFDSLGTKDVTTWNALISGCGTCDEGHKALACFEEMLAAGIQPDDATFASVLAACSHEGLVDEGRKHFNSMVERHDMKPTSEHYICMVDLLGRAGNLEEAENLLLSCGGQSIAVGLRSLLNACKHFGDLERAIRCFESLVILEPQHASAYVLMANAYADAGRWIDVKRIESQRMAAGAKKKPAVAGIEVEEQGHTFVVGENREEIALMVESMNARVKQEGGHIPHTKLVLKPVSEKEKEDALCGHAEKLALAYGLLNTPSGAPLLVTKNLRMCSDCHSSTEIMSRVEKRDIVVRDGFRVHRFTAGCCSCDGRP